MRAFIFSLVVAFVVLSALADNGTTVQRVVTGPVVEFEVGRRIAVAVGANRQSEGMWLQVALNGATLYESRQLASAMDPATVVPGTRVEVTFRCGDGRPGCLASKVRLLDEATPR